MATKRIFPGFRGSRWGASPAEPKATECSPLIHEAVPFIYATTLFNRECCVGYHFNEDRLTSGWYSFGPDDRETAEVVYRNLSAHLCNKYGSPSDPREMISIGGMQGLRRVSEGKPILRWDSESRRVPGDRKSGTIHTRIRLSIETDDHAPDGYFTRALY